MNSRRFELLRGCRLGMVSLGAVASSYLLWSTLSRRYGEPLVGPEMSGFSAALLAVGIASFAESVLRLRWFMPSRAASPGFFFSAGTVAVLATALADPSHLDRWLTNGLTPGVGLHDFMSFALAAYYPGRLLLLAFRELVPRLARRSLWLVPSGLLVFVFLGCGLIIAPHSLVDPGSVSFSESFFTAMSATCVTGLVVLDTGADFTVFGQVMILGLIQVGGLGFMTLFAYFMMAMGGGLGVSHHLAMRELLDQETPLQVRRLLRWIIVATLTTEFLGALYLYFAWGSQCPYADGLERFGFCAFHSISAFCNAGFALSADSLTPSSLDVPANLGFMCLITAGGLGFTVIQDALRQFRYVVDGRSRAGRRPRLTIQTRLVLIASGFLILFGWAGILLGELVAGEGWSGELVLGSLFQSVSARTAGFNTASLAELAPVSLLFLMVLMFIGASPGSTGGGIKTVTAALWVLAISSRLRNRPAIEFQRRELPRPAIQAALVVVGTALIVLLALISLLFLFETDALAAGRFTPIDLVFEGISAFSTVGLSLDVTGELSDASRWVVTLGMFLGRIGPLSLILVMAGTSRAHHSYRYPPGRLMIG